jgi:hypothetical protein
MLFSLRLLALFVLLTCAMNTLFSQTPSEPAIGGAGIGLRPTDDGRIVIDRVAPGGPGDQAGLRPGDWLVEVGGRSVEELTGTRLVDAIRGPVGSKVTLTYRRGTAAPVEATVVRALLGAPPVTSPPQVPRVGEVGPGRTGPAQPVAVAPVRGSTRFLPQTLRDTAANDIVAVTFLLPPGWQQQGRIAWLPEFSVLANLQLKLSDPASGTVVEWLPTQHFSYTDQLPGLIQPGANWMGAILAPPVEDPAAFVQGFWVPQGLSRLRGLRPSSVEDYPGIARQSVARDPGWRARAMRLRYRYDEDGKPWEQDVYCTLAYAPVNNGIAMWNVQRAFTCRAPAGQLDRMAPVLQAIIANVQFTPEWLATYSIVQRLRRQGLQQQMADTAAFGRQLQAYRDEVRQLGQQMHEERMKSADRIAESQREYLAGVETYSDPFQKLAVYLPAGYREHWVNPKGEVILSTEVGFNPNPGDANDWRRMERRDPMKP